MRNGLLSILLFLSLSATAQVTGRYSFAVTPSSGSSSYPASLLGWWKFSGDLTDELGTYNGTAVGSLAYEGDTCLLFSGSGGTDAVNVGDPGAIASIDGMMYLDEDLDENYYFIANNTGNDLAGFRIAADNTVGGFRLLVRAGNDITSGTANSENDDAPLDTWFHFAVVFSNIDGTGDLGCQIWINGVFANVAADTTIGGQAPLTNSGQNVYWGATASPSSGLREGAKLNEVRLWSERLTPAYIGSLASDPYNIPDE